MADKIGIVYDAESGEVRRWIVPDDDAELTTSHPLSPGEEMLIADKASISTSLVDLGGRLQPVADLDAIKAAVAAHIGSKP